jgi:Fe-S oxidoreductase
LQRVEMDKNTHAAWLKSNKEKVAETQRKYQAEWKGSTSQKWSSFKSGIKQRYGLSVEDFQGYLDKQNNRCPICGMCLDECIRHVDHCHKTGEVRGILCFKCNIGLGNFYDSVPNLLGAIKYLQLFEGVLNETETEVPFE